MLGRLSVCAMVAKERIRTFFAKENGEVNIVAIVVLCGIAVLLAIIFKDGIKKILESLFGTIQDSAEKAISDS